MKHISSTRIWSTLQWSSIAAAVTLIGLLLARPRLGLFVAWDVLVPLVPALLLVAPLVWRNICPVAAVNQVPVRFGFGRDRQLPASFRRVAPVASASLLALLVPMRHLLFNNDAAALALLLVGLVVVSLVGGVVYAGKSGWCATFCPVLPVERLYGQQPVVETRHAHCNSCPGCIGACFDLIPTQSMATLAGERQNLRKFTPMAIFAASFPGFVFGYFTTDTGWSVAGVYLWTLLTCGVSLLVLYAVYHLFRMRLQTFLRTSAALAAGLYYWFTVPSIAQAIHQTFNASVGPDWVLELLRGGVVVLIAAWLAVAFRRSSSPVMG